MLNAATTAEHYTAALGNGEIVTSNVPWLVTHVEARPDYRLSVQFIDGTAGDVEMRELIFREDAGVFAALRDPKAFAKVGVDGGAVTWSNGLDIAPDATHEDIQRFGVQRLS